MQAIKTALFNCRTFIQKASGLHLKFSSHSFTNESRSTPCINQRHYSSTPEEKTDPHIEVYADNKKSPQHQTEKVIPGKGPPPELPVYCCMSGCENCVWLTYADELVNYYKDGGPKVFDAIDEHVDDANLKAYLMFELKMRGIKKT